jgi:hypothetical protein
MRDDRLFAPSWRSHLPILSLCVLFPPASHPRMMYKPPQHEVHIVYRVKVHWPTEHYCFLTSKMNRLKAEYLEARSIDESVHSVERL